MKKTIKFIKIIIIIISIMLISQNKILSKSVDTSMDTDIEIGKYENEITSSKGMTEKLLGTFQVIGSIISVIALGIIGIRYMFSSLEEKAQMKGVIIYYIIGAVLVFATSNILGIAFTTINNINTDSSSTHQSSSGVTHGGSSGKF